jgi:hypothetical protein
MRWLLSCDFISQLREKNYTSVCLT